MFAKLNDQKLRSAYRLARAFGTDNAMGGGMMGGATSHHGVYDNLKLWETEDKASLVIELTDKKGALAKVLSVMDKHNIDLTQINSKPPKIVDDRTGAKSQRFYIDFHGSHNTENVKKCMQELQKDSQNVLNMQEIGTSVVPWFPLHITDFDEIGKRTLSEGDGIQDADHPGFRDKVYQARRTEITDVALSYKIGEDIPRIKYTDVEKDVWKFCYERLGDLMKKNACKEFNDIIDEFEKHVGFRADEIPQLDDISKYLQSKSGWRLKPVGGLLTQREFLNGLAFKVFHSTQYIRHHSAPLYTPEPDIIHELMGHAPMFANKDFSDFSQEIGLASLGASELDIKRLGAIYWFTIEFGMCRENDALKAYGAGILSSVGELEYCVTDKPKFHRFCPHEVAQNHLEFPISSMQPYYFVADSFEIANLTYNNSKHSVEVNRPLKTRREILDGQLLF